MTTLTVGGLHLNHSNNPARVTLPDGSSLEGTLMFAANPAYRRLITRHWWLVTKSESPLFDSEAISLQWSESAPVELIEEVA